MSKLQVQCDVCGAILAAKDASADYDGIDRCRRCEWVDAISELERKRDKLKEWLEQTHLARLRELDSKIALLKMYPPPEPPSQ